MRKWRDILVGTLFFHDFQKFSKKKNIFLSKKLIFSEPHSPVPSGKSSHPQGGLAGKLQHCLVANTSCSKFVPCVLHAFYYVHPIFSHCMLNSEKTADFFLWERTANCVYIFSFLMIKCSPLWCSSDQSTKTLRYRKKTQGTCIPFCVQLSTTNHKRWILSGQYFLYLASLEHIFWTL